MHTLSIAIFFWMVIAISAYPVKLSEAADVQVLAFANVLEQLESAFYTQALKQFNTSSFQAAYFAAPQIPIQQIQTIASDENIHEITLQSAINALGGRVVSGCTFNFSSVLTDVNTMVAAARVVENVGVSAYLGALSSLAHPALVTVTGSILTVEARHQSILNLLSNATSIPQPFDVALTPADVLAIAGTFISGCELGFSANPPLIITNGGTLRAGMKLNFSSPALNGIASQLSCKIVTGGSNTSIYQPLDGCMVPANVTGPIPANSSIVVAGPALLFIDQPDLIGGLIRPGFNASGTAIGSSTTLSTISMSTMGSGLSSVASGATLPIPGTTSAPPVPVYPSTASTTAVPSWGAYTTTLSPAQASALLSSLIN